MNDVVKLARGGAVCYWLWSVVGVCDHDRARQTGGGGGGVVMNGGGGGVHG